MKNTFEAIFMLTLLALEIIGAIAYYAFERYTIHKICFGIVFFGFVGRSLYLLFKSKK